MFHEIRAFFIGDGEIQREIRALEALSDHELADLGIARDQIAEFVEGHFAEPGTEVVQHTAN